MMIQEEVLVKLYYLLASADGVITKKELEMGKKIIFHEHIDEKLFHQELESLMMTDRELLYEYCLKGMQQLSHRTRVRYLAWMILIANGDGLMDDTEWKLIYRLYHKDLGILLTDIMNEQKVLNQLIKTSNSGDTGVSETWRDLSPAR